MSRESRDWDAYRSKCRELLRSLSVMVMHVSRVAPGLALASSTPTGNNIFLTLMAIYADGRGLSSDWFQS
jgi:hypothetical protein